MKKQTRTGPATPEIAKETFNFKLEMLREAVEERKKNIIPKEIQEEYDTAYNKVFAYMLAAQNRQELIRIFFNNDNEMPPAAEYALQKLETLKINGLYELVGLEQRFDKLMEIAHDNSDTKTIKELILEELYKELEG